MSTKLTRRRAVGVAAAVAAAAPVLAFSAANAAATGATPPIRPTTLPTPPIPTRPGPTVTLEPPPTTEAPTLVCRAVTYETADVVPTSRWYRIFPARARYRLTVSGAANAGGTVKLVAHTYIRQPEYWGIEVQRCADPNRAYPAVMRPYTVTLDVQGSMGTRGIEVIGSNQSQRFDLPPRPTRPAPGPGTTTAP
jgi:hypothetical protein